MNDWIGLAKAISDPSRVRILKMLERGELCVCQMTDALGLAQSTVSKHLAQLRQAGLVSDRKQGLWVYYRLCSDSAGPDQRAFMALLRDALNDDPLIIADGQASAGCGCQPDEVEP